MRPPVAAGGRTATRAPERAPSPYPLRLPPQHRPRPRRPATSAIAIERSRNALQVPLVTRPIERPSIVTAASARPMRRPPSSSPTRRRGTPAARWRTNASFPTKSRPSSFTTQSRPDFERRHRVVDLVAVEAEPRLEPQTVARAETDGQQPAVAPGREQPVPDPLGVRRRHEDLEAVLASVAGARHHRGGSVDRSRDQIEGAQRGDVARCERSEDLGRERSLEREQRGRVRDVLDAHFALEANGVARPIADPG